jgi:hypothetical protein
MACLDEPQIVAVVYEDVGAAEYTAKAWGVLTE